QPLRSADCICLADPCWAPAVPERETTMVARAANGVRQVSPRRIGAPVVVTALRVLAVGDGKKVRMWHLPVHQSAAGGARESPRRSTPILRSRTIPPGRLGGATSL